METEIGKYYVAGNFIYKAVEYINYKCNNPAINTRTGQYYNHNAHISNYNTTADREATKEEIQWLDACINAERFVPKEEALKDFKKDLNYDIY